MRSVRFWGMAILGMLGLLATRPSGAANAADGAETAEAGAAKADMGKPGIILVAFGTSIPEAQKVFDGILASARKRFPGHDIVYGFTARSIVKTLREEQRDHGVLTLEEALAELKKRGHTTVVLQSLHVSPGQKDAELSKADTLGMKAAFGKPLLASDADLAKMVDALAGEIRPDRPTVFCGHGNDKHPEYNARMIAFDKAVRAKSALALLCTVEGQPGTDALEATVKPAVGKAGGKVHFVPMMIVAGDHILNDVSGDEADSWKNRIGAKEITIAKPLGYNDAVLNLFWDHLAQAAATLESPAQ